MVQCPRNLVTNTNLSELRQCAAEVKRKGKKQHDHEASWLLPGGSNGDLSMRSQNEKHSNRESKAWLSGVAVDEKKRMFMQLGRVAPAP